MTETLLTGMLNLNTNKETKTNIIFKLDSIITLYTSDATKLLTVHIDATLLDTWHKGSLLIGIWIDLLQPTARLTVHIDATLLDPWHKGSLVIGTYSEAKNFTLEIVVNLIWLPITTLHFVMCHMMLDQSLLY